MMDRRAFITIVGGSALLAAPLAAGAQAGRPARIGILCHVPCQGRAVEAFGRALRELGYVEGRTVVFEYRDAEWKIERLPALATDLVQRKVDVIFTSWGTAAALAAKRATNTIPVVIGAVGDPVRAGIVASLAKPGGNVTGVSSLALELEGKRLELVKEVIPKVSGGRFLDPGRPLLCARVPGGGNGGPHARFATPRGAGERAIRS
jgi:putative ABC transport system substrate-binding protein